MSLALVTCSTVLEFIQDTKTFNNCINECFEMLDFEDNGMLSKDVLCGGLHRLLSLEYNPQEEEEEVNNLYEVIFMRFDKDKNGFIDCKEFECLIRELMLAMARGIGDSPVLVALEESSLLMKAVQHELASMNKDRRKTKKREKNVLLDICLCCHKLETS